LRDKSEQEENLYMPKFKYIPKTVNKNSAMSLREKLKGKISMRQKKENFFELRKKSKVRKTSEAA
jgi:hypothetical protein